MTVKAKKHLGQHFLNAPEICQQIADELKNEGQSYKKVLEIGPGMGALTTYLLKRNDFDTYVIDIDSESIDYLKSNFPDLKNRIFEGDFLKEDFDQYFGTEPFAIAGNFPYNISSQILFKIVENRDLVPEVVGMFQKEVAERVAEGPGKKAYGILSVFLQAFYDIRYCFTVDEHVFTPPPKVKSGVIRMVRNQRELLDCDEELFKRVVKMAFNQRRKTLRNSLKPLLTGLDTSEEILNLRPERLSVDDFIGLTNKIDRK